MSGIPYRLVRGEDGSETLTVFVAGEAPVVVQEDHPNYIEILDIARESDALTLDEDQDEILELADPSVAVHRNLDALSERVRVAGGTVYFDGDPVKSVITDHIVRLLYEGREAGEGGWRALVNFLEKLADNPVPHSQHRLYGWLQATGGFTIAEDGDIIAYKGVSSDLRSLHSGPGIVNGVEQTGRLDNSVGNVVEIARSAVEANPSVGCSIGLHAGTWEYASSFGARVVTVKFSPRDVVSVPTDCSDQKVRVCRYEVIEADLDSAYSTPIFSLGD